MKKGFWSLLGALTLFAFGFGAGPAFAESDEMGNAENNYRLYCTSCHGPNGDGKGQLAEALAVPPRDHTDASKMGKRTDEQLFKAISEGGDAVGLDSGMPPHNTILQKEDIRSMVKYLRKLCNCKYTK
ncbi:MAG: c-type cytochrome [Nitrospinae bacterium]|nr:c-type cytochrome [Nitrospinota bacterium]